MQVTALLAPWLAFAPAPAVLASPMAAPAAAAVCPADMVLVEGIHYEELQRLCIDKRKNKCWAFLPGLVTMEPRRTAVRVCMDRYEWPNRKGEKPHVMMRFTEAEASCNSVGKRMCSEFEWEKACEGPQQLPWPYGWKQQPKACNNHKRYRAYSFSKLHANDRAVRERETRRLWQGAESGSYPSCRSAAGVEDLVGNVEEWVSTSRPQWPYRSSLKGGFWAKPWSGCRGTNEAHAPAFRFYEIGFRCCRAPSAP